MKNQSRQDKLKIKKVKGCARKARIKSDSNIYNIYNGKQKDYLSARKYAEYFQTV